MRRSLLGIIGATVLMQAGLLVAERPVADDIEARATARRDPPPPKAGPQKESWKARERRLSRAAGRNPGRNRK